MCIRDSISSAYVNGCRQFDSLRVAAVADIVPEAAQAKAAEHDLICAGSVEALLADPDIEIVINLTVPSAHAAVSYTHLDVYKRQVDRRPAADFGHDDAAGALQREVLGGQDGDHRCGQLGLFVHVDLPSRPEADGVGGGGVACND